MMDIDIADSPFLTLAMLLDAPIWSNDAHFKRQNAARVLTTKHILPLLGI
jgi:predicted nucleic acid-binding protein